MIVLTIMAMMMGIATMFIGSISNSKLKAEALHLSGALRLVYGRAAINGTRYQFVINLDDNSYRAECSEGNIAVLTSEEIEEQEREHRYDRNDEEADPFGLGASSATFDDCSEPLLEDATLRPGVRFQGVLTSHDEDVIEDGEVAIGFFPSGFVERSIIWLEQENGEAMMTLTIDPMSGRVRVHPGDFSVPDDFFEVEED